MNTQIVKVIYLILFLFCALTWGCTKPAPQTFTVQGSFFNGTTNSPWANQTFSAKLNWNEGLYPHRQFIDGIKTDSNGKFKFTYSDDGSWNSLVLNFGLRQLNLHAGRNIDSSFVVSSMGKIRIKLTTSLPLETNHDTLFIAYYNAAGIVVWDTITHTINGFYKELIFKPTTAGIGFGRGYNQIHSWPWFTDRFFSRKSAQFAITGDPKIDTGTINY